MSDGTLLVTAHVDALVAKLNVATIDGQALTREGIVLPRLVTVWGHTGGRSPETVHHGSATLELTGEGVVAHLSVSPGTARRLLTGDLRAALDLDQSGRLVGKVFVIDHWTARGIYLSSDITPAWPDLWIREA